jgi:catechol 2,3-dioxygenase-like lactoylglutathione lyase family enzyme
MAKVTGVGALIILSHHPADLADWYTTRLGIKTTFDKTSGCHFGEIEDAIEGKTLRFAIVAASDEHKPGTGSLMVNYRVDDLDEFLKQLAVHRVFVKRTIEGEYGRFAYVRDPEGNPIEIWEEPKA